jgi:hypothetical protein
MSPIPAVWSDIGEVPITQTREYGTGADWLGIPRRTFFPMSGSVITRASGGPPLQDGHRHWRNKGGGR